MNYTKEPEIKDILINALDEDIGTKDITTEAIIPADKFVNAILLAKEDCVVCGLSEARLALRLKDNKIRFRPLVREGERVKKSKVIARIFGKARSILTAERVVLNFLSLLCGIATRTREYVDAVKPYKVKIIDTRKTIPGLRILEKYAVRIGGGFNHRFSLDEMVMVKDNHLKVIGGHKKLAKLSRRYKSEIEVEDLRGFKEALKLKPDIIMLDNMSVKEMKKAVSIRNKLSPRLSQPTPKLEASGNITLKNVKRVASCGVEMISVGALTHSVKSIDISLEIQ
jgi:nicotinate-nucleotide pyrophosphorylase (carboxylating)